MLYRRFWQELGDGTVLDYLVRNGNQWVELAGGDKKPMSGKRRKSSQNWLTFVE
jgi:hypothetical protein